MSRFFSQESLTSSQSQLNSSIVVPLVKFSCSLTNQGDATSAQWTHYSRSDLELVIQEVQVGGSGNERYLSMKVVAGAEYLEEQNLNDVVRIYKNFVLSPGSEVPVRVVVKPPLLALRYPKLNDIRRLQFRFRGDSDFNQVLNILTNLGLTATESLSSGPVLQSRPPTADSTSSGISNGYSSVAGYLPLTPNSEFKVPMRPDSASSILQRPSSSYTPQSDNHLYVRPQSAMSISSFMPQSKPSSEPLNRAQSLYVSQFEREQRQIQSSNSLLNTSDKVPANGNAHVNRILLPKAEESQRRFSTSPFFETQRKHCLPDRMNLFSSVNDPHNSRNKILENALDFFSPVEDRSSPRSTEYPFFGAPGKRPISLPAENDICLGLPIPPKRQLPFATVKEPLRSKSVSVADTSRPVQAPQQRKRPLEEFMGESTSNGSITPAKKPAKRRVASRKGTTHLPEINDLSSKAFPSKDSSASDTLDIPMQTAKSPPLEARRIATPIASDKAPSKLQAERIEARQQSVPTLKMVNRSTQTQTFSGRDHTAALKPASNTSAVDLQSTRPTASVLQDDLDLVVSRYSSGSRVNLAPNYNDLPDDKRHKMLNDFIIKNLENDDFLKLAEDMDVSWRRIGLTR
ncbi:uncharacterized protein EAE98_007243 [Botrytis deweyae]|uniref:Ig-like domain-containing protein n=1 Tax=Botrytis deweyae TaxID=2478750 RepID=A0ABQ7IIG9_9HELO|nr:uncharacterized protein EAE98_007243 [Botrytis deweyae]KAF7925155.1 hypothetical protein EAE98_007243 [Botrytis deweyae]